MAENDNHPKNPNVNSVEVTADQRNKKRGKKPSPAYVEPYIYIHDKKLNTYKVVFYMAVVKGGQPVYLQKSGIKGIMEARRVLHEFKTDLQKRKDRFAKGDRKWKTARETAYKKILGEEKQKDLSNDEYNIRKSLEKHTQDWNELYLSEITQQMVSDFVNALPNIEPTTKNKIRQHISRVFQLNGSYDPAKQIKIRGYRKSNSRRLAGLTQDEMARLIEHAKKVDPNGFGLLIEFSYFLSCRSAELWALEWDNLVKDQDGEYYFLIKRSYNWYEKRFKSPKNGEIREVAIPTDLLATIKQLQLNKPDPKFVLPRLKEWEQGQASKKLRSYLQDLKIIDSQEDIEREKKDGVKNPRNTIRFHDLRGISITHALAGSKDLPAVMQRVGHKSLAVTSLYLKKVEDRQRRAVANNLNLSNRKGGEVIQLKKQSGKK